VFHKTSLNALKTSQIDSVCEFSSLTGHSIKSSLEGKIDNKLKLKLVGVGRDLHKLLYSLEHNKPRRMDNFLILKGFFCIFLKHLVSWKRVTIIL